MNIMKQNDYVSYYDNIAVQVISGEAHLYTVRELCTGIIAHKVRCKHISLMIKGVLEAIGFKEVDDAPIFECVLSNQYTTIFITYSIKPFNRECKITSIDGGILGAQHIVMLDNLQDFIRDNTSLELNVDEKALIEAVKINQYR